MAYSPVYSFNLIGYTPDEPDESFSVPAGKTAIVRDITFFTADAGGGLLTYFENPPGVEPLHFSYLTTPGSFGYDQWHGRVVVPQEALIAISITGATTEAYVTVSGYILTNVVS